MTTRYLRKNENYTKQMSNKEFYEQIVNHEQDELVIFTPSKGFSWKNFIKIPIGKRTIAVHVSISQFAAEIMKKIGTNQLFTQQTLEAYLKKSSSVVMRLIYEGKYLRIKRNWSKFYIKKDWE